MTLRIFLNAYALDYHIVTFVKSENHGFYAGNFELSPLRRSFSFVSKGNKCISKWNKFTFK